MAAIPGKFYKLHLFIFILLSIQLFLLTPVAFLNKFLAAAICLGVLFNLKKIRFEFKRWYEALIFIIVSAYLTLAFFGFDLFLEAKPQYLIDLSYYQGYIPEADFSSLLSMASPYISMIYFLLGFVWTSYVLKSLLDFVDSFIEYKDKVCVPYLNDYWKKWLVLLVICFSVFMIWQRAFAPIVITDDSWSYLGGYRSGIYNTGSSPVYSFLINIVLSLIPKIAWVAFTQIILFSLLLATILMYFNQKGVRFKYIILAAFILPLIPSLGLHTIVVWVDLANGMALLWFTYVLVRIIDEVIINKRVVKKQLYSFGTQLCISMVLVFFMRANSFPVYIVMVPILTGLFIIKKQWKLLISVIISLIIVLIIRFPGYNALGVYVHEQSVYHKYIAGIHDLHSTYYQGGQFSEQALAKLKQMIPQIDEPDAKANFQPDWTRYLEYDLDIVGELTTAEFISLYTESLFRNPAKMMRSMLYRVRAYWVIDAKGYVNTIGHPIDMIARPAGPADLPELDIYRSPNFLTNIMHKYTMGASLPLPSVFIWRYGLWTGLMAVCILILTIKRRFIWSLVFLPVFIYIGTLYLTNAWTDYRYGLPVFLIGLFLPLAFILTSRDSIETNEVPE
ncbi:MAG: hypothetical protein FWE14_00850 [Lachnospiraceae bacterium]|nr:hypothetical protein [Lachnospiraceae bacterium]